MAVYLDTSALAKLVIRERETGPLRRWLGRRPDPVATSDLARTELLRATRRAAPDRMPQARAVLASVDLIRVSTEICESAAMIEPKALRSLDAVHLASALALGDDLDVVVCYDQRLIDASVALGLRTASPGAS
jgi:predicted nucleic acid-binding protein